MKSIFPLCLFFFLAIAGNIYSAKHDTAIYTHWKNGYPKTLTFYKIKLKKDVHENPVKVLKIKKVMYFDREGEEISKRNFDFFYSSNMRFDAMDSLWEAKRVVHPIQDTSAKLYLGIGNNEHAIPLRITDSKDGSKIYREKDTVIHQLKYYVLEFGKDTISGNSSSYKFSGALRTDKYKIYYFNGASGSEELTTDLEAIVKEYTGKVTDLLEGSAEIYGATRQGIKKGTEKASAFILANLILMFR